MEAYSSWCTAVPAEAEFPVFCRSNLINRYCITCLSVFLLYREWPGRMADDPVVWPFPLFFFTCSCLISCSSFFTEGFCSGCSRFVAGRRVFAGQAEGSDGLFFRCRGLISRPMVKFSASPCPAGLILKSSSKPPTSNSPQRPARFGQFPFCRVGKRQELASPVPPLSPQWLLRLPLSHNQAEIVIDTLNLSGVIRKYHQFDVIAFLFVADGHIQKASCPLASRTNSFHVRCRQIKKLKRALLTKHSDKPCLAMGFLLVFQHCINKQRKISSPPVPTA